MDPSDGQSDQAAPYSGAFFLVALAGGAAWAAGTIERNWLKWAAYAAAALTLVGAAYCFKREAAEEKKRAGPSWHTRAASVPWLLVRPLWRGALVASMVAVGAAEVGAIAWGIATIIREVRAAQLPTLIEFYLVGVSLALAWDIYAALSLYVRVTRSMYRRNLNQIGIEPNLNGGFENTYDHNITRSLCWRLFLSCAIFSLLSWLSVGYGLYRLFLVRSLRPIASLEPSRPKELAWGLWVKQLPPEEVRKTLLELHGPGFQLIIDDGAAALEALAEDES